jgi:hypothetical protein
MRVRVRPPKPPATSAPLRNCAVEGSDRLLFAAPAPRILYSGRFSSSMVTPGSSPPSCKGSMRPPTSSITSLVIADTAPGMSCKASRRLRAVTTTSSSPVVSAAATGADCASAGAASEAANAKAPAVAAARRQALRRDVFGWSMDSS